MRHTAARRLLVAAVTVGALLALLHQRRLWSQLSHVPAPAWSWLAVVAGLIGLTYVCAALALRFASARPLPMGRTVLVQLAAAVTNRVVPSGLGGAAVNVRYLQRRSLSLPRATTAVALVSLAHGVAWVLLMLAVLPWAGASVGVPHLPVPPWAAAAGGTALLALAAWGLPRAWARSARLRDAVRQAGEALAELRRRPGHAAGVVAVIVASKLAHALAFAAALHAFGGHLALPVVVAAYLGGTATANAVPTPGGLGSTEAVLVAALTALGGVAAVVVAGVLVFRALVWGLPVLPGLAAWRVCHEVRLHHPRAGATAPA